MIPKQIIDFAETYATNQTQYIGWIYVTDALHLTVYAFRKTKKYGFELLDVIRASSDKETAQIRSMYLTGMSGWKVFYKPTDAESSGWYGYNYYTVRKEDFNKWEEYQEVPGVWYRVLNPEALKGTKYQYCGYTGGEIIKYIKLWEQHPCVEYFGKIGMIPSKAIIKKLENDHGFGKWLAKQDKEELKDNGPQVILYAYTHHRALCEAKEILTEKHQAEQYCSNIPEIRGTKIDKLKLCQYMIKNKVYARNYNDYLEAIKNLGFDLSDTKNIYPKDFKRMHDLRTAQWGAKKNKAIVAEFKAAAKKYKAFEFTGEEFAIIIPSKPQDLKREGEALNHCVGRMGYDQKMVKGQSFIAFLRHTDKIKKPFVTIEFETKSKKIVQIYGYHDSAPPEDARKFAKAWERRVKKQWTTAQIG